MTPRLVDRAWRFGICPALFAMVDKVTLDTDSPDCLRDLVELAYHAGILILLLTIGRLVTPHRPAHAATLLITQRVERLEGRRHAGSVRRRRAS